MYENLKKLLMKIFQRLTLRSRIVITFSIMVIFLVIIFSRISYYTLREIYLNQLSEHVDFLTRDIAINLNLKYFDYLVPTSDSTVAMHYYQEQLDHHLQGMNLEQIFIFRRDLDIIFKMSKTRSEMNPTPALILNSKPIENLYIGHSITSNPFKSQSGQWYLWGFYRLDEKYFLGIRENASRLAKVDQLSIIFWFIGAIAILITLIAGWFIARVISKPVERLVNFSEELGKGNFRYPLPKDIKGELNVLGTAMDKMRLALDKHNSEKSEMLAHIAHEIRNPLGGIELLAGLVKEDLRKQNLDISYASKILEEIQKLKFLISEYLNYSRPVQPRPNWVNIETEINEVKELLQNKFRDKKINLIYSGTESKIWFDKNHFRQILINLISNSVDFSPTDGQIEIKTTKKQDKLTLHISDEGLGILNENTQKIFNPFFTTKKNGIGLGLAICKKLCEENEASINVKNNENKGCTFYIEKKQ